MSMGLFDDIQTVFIDLDDTLWDFTANSKVAMREVFFRHHLDEQCPFDKFIACYLRHNTELWTLYHHGKITKDFLVTERFRMVFDECSIRIPSNGFSAAFNEDYLNAIVLCKQTVEGAEHLLQHLSKRGSVHILSNGFKNLQWRKLQSGGLDKYIDTMVLSDDIGITKPDRRLFDYALSVVGGFAENTVMIGDNYDADVLGAHNAGWHTVYFNRVGDLQPDNVADLTVCNLVDIEKYL